MLMKTENKNYNCHNKTKNQVELLDILTNLKCHKSVMKVLMALMTN